MLIEYTDVDERHTMLALLKGVEDKVWVRVTGHDRVYALADEDMERENADKTSAVHFLRFDLTPAMRRALAGGAEIAIGVDHPVYAATIECIPGAARAALVQDLQG